MAWTRTSLLNYFSNLPNNPEERMVIGQHMSPWRTPADQYARYIESLYTDTGRFVGLLGANYGRGQTLSEMVAWNPYLIDYWDMGGFVTVDWHPNNPWTGNQCTDQSQSNLTQLINPASAVYPTWIGMLDNVATALQQLENEGVVVLWRPWPEMTFTYLFWWSANNRETAFINAWRHMYDYLTTTKGLSNLLWVYCVANQEPWWPASGPYPGSSYVDMVGVDIYRDSTQILGAGYANLTSLGKPFCIPEIGPGTVDGTFDSSIHLTNIRNNYPLTTWAQWWHSWNHPDYANRVAIIHNQGRSKLMYDHWAVCREEHPDWLAYITHEPGDLSEYDVTVTGGGDLSVTSSGLASTSYKLDILVDDTTDKYGQKSISPTTDVVRARLYVDPNGISFPTNLDNFVIFTLWRTGGSPYNAAYIELGISSGMHTVRALANNDGGGLGAATARVTISDAPHRIEIRLVRSSSATASDGTIGLRVDNSNYVYATGVDNFDLWAGINAFRVGQCWGTEAGTSGRIFIDEIGVTDTASPIGASVTASMIEPNGDRSTDWNTTGVNHYGTIDDGLPSPGEPTETDYITVPASGSGDIDSFTMETISISGAVTEITVWLRSHVRDTASFNLEVSLWNSDESVQYGSTQTVEKTPYANVIGHGPTNTEGHWESVGFTGLSLTQAQLNGLVVRLDGDAGGAAVGVTRVFALYGLITEGGATTSTSTSTTTTSTSTTTTSTSTTTTTSLTATSTSTTTVTTTTLAPTGGIAWGEQNPTQGETAVSWQTWSDGAGGLPDISGDADWGKVDLDFSEQGRSDVYDFGDISSRLLTLTENRYGAGLGDATLQIRGSNTSFNQDDITPAWVTYSVPIWRTWRYVQVRELYNS